MRCPPWGHIVAATTLNGGGGNGGTTTIIRTIRVGFPTEKPGPQEFGQILSKADPIVNREELRLYEIANSLKRQINSLDARLTEVEA